MKKKKIAILFPYSMTAGGEVVTAWVIEALKDEYSITLFTLVEINVDKFNKFYGTHLSTEDFKVIKPPLSFLLEKLPEFGLLKYHFLIRYCKPLLKNFDLVIGTYKEADFGRKGIQYIYSPDLTVDEMRLNPAEFDFLYKIYFQKKFFRNIYKNFCYIISGFNKKNMEKNTTLAISEWTQGAIKKVLGIDSIVLYPPVLNDFIEVPWEKKENGFICLGHISPGKQITSMIQVLKSVRNAGFDIHMHIIGNIEDYSYYKEIKKMQEGNSWIFIDGLMQRQELSSMVSRHKYGINGRKDEHFGIAVVEMMKAGCIVFVQEGAGQREVVNSGQLIFADKEDAVKKIINVLSNKDLQNSLLNHVAQRSGLFSTDRFINEIRQIAKDNL